MAIHLGRPLPDASRDRPGRQRGNAPCRPSPDGLSADTPSLLGLAPGGVCRAAPVAGRAVRSYRTLSPLPAGGPRRSRLGRRFAFCGTFPRVAPAGRYPAPYFRGARTFLPPVSRRAAIRPSGARGKLGNPEHRRKRRMRKDRPSVKNGIVGYEYFCVIGVMAITLWRIQGKVSPVMPRSAISRPMVSSSATPSKRFGR